MSDTKAIFSVERAEESTGFLLWQVSSLWQRNLNTLLRKYNLTHAQFVVLASTTWLTIKLQNITQVQIANHAKMDVMLVSNILKTLEKKSLIQRTLSKVDSRAKIVNVTHSGITLSQQTVQDVETYDKQFFKILDQSLPNFNQELLNLSLQ